MKRTYVLGAVFIAAFAALGAAQLKSTLRTYVSFSEARASEATVQVKGAIDKKSVRSDAVTGALVFDITDEAGQRMTVHYTGTRPGNFNQASHVVAIGTYRNGVFGAEELLIKCPSKYQGQDASKGM